MRAAITSKPVTPSRWAALVRRAVPAAPAARLALVASGAWLVIFGTYANARYRGYEAARLDLGNMTQAVWNTAHGRFLEATTIETGATVSRLGGHVDPILAAFAPLWWLWSSPMLLLTASVVALASGAVPVYLLALKYHGSERTAVLFALAYLLCPITQWNAVWDFHPVTLAIPLVLFAVWFLEESRLVPFALVALLAAACKEEIGLAVGCLGLWYARRHGRKLAGLAILAAGAALTLFDFLVVIPHYAVNGSNPYAGRYTEVGGTPTGIAHTLLTHPLRLLEAAFSLHNLAYLVFLAALAGGLFVAAPLLALGAVPDVLINVLSNNPNQTSIQFQYTAGIYPFLLAGSVVGASRLGPRLPSARAARAILLAALVGCLVAGPLRYYPSTLGRALPGSSERERAEAAIARIPGKARLSATNRLGGHLSERRYLYTFPVLRDADWAVVDDRDPTYDEALLRRSVRRLRADARWAIVSDRDGIAVFRRR